MMDPQLTESHSSSITKFHPSYVSLYVIEPMMVIMIFYDCGNLNSHVKFLSSSILFLNFVAANRISTNASF